MADYEVVRHPDVLAFIITSPQGPVMLDLMRRGQRVVNRARQLAPVNTGALRASINMEQITSPGGDPAVRVGTNLRYAIYVHEGTGIYGRGTPIVPVRATILRWPAVNNSGSGTRRYRGGATAGYVFARQSRGTPGRPFLRDALDAAR